VAAHTAAVASEQRAPIAAAAAGACVVLAAAVLARWEAGVVWAVALAAAAYAAALAVGDAPRDGWAPIAGAGLVASAELGQWAVELARPASVERGILVRRVGAIALVAAAGAATGWAMLLASEISSRGLAVTAAGLAAAAAAMWLVARLARAGEG
jgi:hypothetical protein